MIIKEDTKQSLKSTFIFFIDFYKIFIGNFLTLTVPKNCGTNSCTIINNIYDNHLFHKIALYTNCICFILFIIMYAIEIKREKWCINYLDEDRSKSISNLDLEIENYGDLKKEMYSINYKYALIIKICIFSQFTNICISGIDIYYKWNGYSSFTPFSSYVFVILMKLYNSYYISHESLLYERAYSCFLTDPKIYNTIDYDYKIKENNCKINKVYIIYDNYVNNMLNDDNSIDNNSNDNNSNDNNSNDGTYYSENNITDIIY